MAESVESDLCVAVGVVLGGNSLYLNVIAVCCWWGVGLAVLCVTAVASDEDDMDVGIIWPRCHMLDGTNTVLGRRGRYWW